LQQLVAEAENVHGIGLNAQLPMACSMSTICSPDDPKLTFEKWQKPLISSAPDLYVVQDTANTNLWDEIGCGHDDLLIYDQMGRVHSYLPSKGSFDMINNTDITGDEFIEQDIRNPVGYANVLHRLKEAKEATEFSRCFADFDDDGGNGDHTAGGAPHDDANNNSGVLLATLVGMGIFFIAAYKIAMKAMRKHEERKAYRFAKVLDDDDDDNDNEIEFGNIGSLENGDDDIGDVFNPEVFNTLRQQFEKEYGEDENSNGEAEDSNGEAEDDDDFNLDDNVTQSIDL